VIKRLRFIVTFLLAGAILSFVAAQATWYIAGWNMGYTSTTRLPTAFEVWRWTRGEPEPYRPPIDKPLGVSTRLGVTSIRVDGSAVESPFSEMHELQIGLPFRALCSRSVTRAVGTASDYSAGRSGSLEIMLPNRYRNWRLTPHQVPVMVLWPGFVANAVIYGFALWLLLAVPPVAYRRWRRKPGHCPKCGYDLRGTEHEKCPECGLEHRTARAA
jgi:hypothetical protein